MSALEDVEVLEARARSEMARCAAYKSEADRGSFDAINARTFLRARIDVLLDQYRRAQVMALLDTLEPDEACEGA